MKIKSKISGRIQDITLKDWEGIRKRGQDSNFEVLSTSNTPAPSTTEPRAETPVETQTSGANFNTLLRRGRGAQKQGNHEEALKFFKEAEKINSNNLIKGKIAEAEAALEKQRNRPAEESSEEK